VVLVENPATRSFVVEFGRPSNGLPRQQVGKGSVLLGSWTGLVLGLSVLIEPTQQRLSSAA
jgi:hypothetical protein